MRHFGEYFGKIRDLLTEDGVAMVHSIGKMSPPGATGPYPKKIHLPRRLCHLRFPKCFEATENQRALGSPMSKSCGFGYAPQFPGRMEPASSKRTAPKSPACTTNGFAACGSLPGRLRDVTSRKRQRHGLPHAAQPPTRRRAFAPRLHRRPRSTAEGTRPVVPAQRCLPQNDRSRTIRL